MPSSGRPRFNPVVEDDSGGRGGSTGFRSCLSLQVKIPIPTKTISKKIAVTIAVIVSARRSEVTIEFDKVKLGSSAGSGLAWVSFSR